MANEADGDGNALQVLLGQVPDRHHAPTRSSALLSVNGRHPAPLHLWHPDYCGEVDMAISADGTWYHEGVPIKRPSYGSCSRGFCEERQTANTTSLPR